MRTAVRQHQWVKHVQIPVDVVSDPITGKPVVLMDASKAELCLDNGVHGCAACSAPLDQQSVTTECPGSDFDLDRPLT
jgi:hypothetical protein